MNFSENCRLDRFDVKCVISGVVETKRIYEGQGIQQKHPQRKHIAFFKVEGDIVVAM